MSENYNNNLTQYGGQSPQPYQNGGYPQDQYSDYEIISDPGYQPQPQPYGYGNNGQIQPQNNTIPVNGQAPYQGQPQQNPYQTQQNPYMGQPQQNPNANYQQPYQGQQQVYGQVQQPVYGQGQQQAYGQAQNYTAGPANQQPQQIYINVNQNNNQEQMQAQMNQPLVQKSKFIALLLNFFLGFLGVHRFYLGWTASGVAMLVLFLIGCIPIIGLIPMLILGIWDFVDFVRILFGNLKPKDGVYS